MPTKDWGDLKLAKVLFLGHDPRLQSSNTIAEYCFFANYYFNQYPKEASERKKYNFAATVFNHVQEMTNYIFEPEEIYITNLCNEDLPHAPNKKNVYIPRDKAEQGVCHIKEILNDSNIKYIFATSQQVNYWLQLLGFYKAEEDYLLRSVPKESGIMNDPQYYEPKKQKSFQRICGEIYITADGKYKVIPILHPKTYTFLKNNSIYSQKYNNIKAHFSKNTANNLLT